MGNESPSLPTGPVYPQWWTGGVVVIGKNGAVGRIAKKKESWSVMTDGFEYPSPNPMFWSLFIAPVVTRHQARQIAYEAGAAMYEAYGTGGVRHWNALSDSERMDGALPSAKFRTELDGLRSIIISAVLDAIDPYLE